MSDTTYDPADPRLTAYVLGELDDAECREVEQQLERCAESRAAVEEIRETVGLVATALAAEPAATLTDEQRTAIADEAEVAVATGTRPQSPWRGQVVSFVAGVSAAAVAILLVLPQLQRAGTRADGMRPVAAEGDAVALGEGSDIDDDLAKNFKQKRWLASSPAQSPSAGAETMPRSHAASVGDGASPRRRWGAGPVEFHDGEQSTRGGQRGGSDGAPATTISASTTPGSPSPPTHRVTSKTERLLREQERSRNTTQYVPSDGEDDGRRRGYGLVSERQPQSRTAPAPSRNGRPVTSYDASNRPIVFFDRRDGRGPGGEAVAGSTGLGRRERPGDVILGSKVKLTDPNQIDRSKTRLAGTTALGLEVNADAGVVGSIIIDERPGNEQYQPIIENPFLSPNNDPLSTFSIDVDTASYSNVRRFLKHNQFPPPNAVRIEELVNYFHYDYPEPADGRPFSVNLEAGPCPWNSEHRLVRVGLKGKEIDKSQRPPSNLVFLLDVSGSMRDANKLPLVKTAMEMLVSEMTEDDRIAIVTYAGKAGLKLPSTSGQDKTRIIDAIHALSAGGSTNGEAGIRLAYEQAVDHFIDDGANRVILCTDGDFNVGTSGDKELVTLIQEQAKSKVFLSVFGFGMGNLKDGKLEQIADKGNGQYGYIDNEKEAHKVFVEEMAGTLYTIAKDVKLQVEFNPQQVGGYRLIGYENRMLAAKDFNDDTKDAGEIGAGHTVTALYEVVPFDKLPAAKPVDDLKYQKPIKVNDDDKMAKELLTVKLRYKQPDAEQSVKIDFTLTDDKPQTKMPSVDFEWAASCAGFGLLLRNSQYRGQADFALIRELAMGSRGDDESGRRREFLDMVFTAHALHARATGQPIPPRESLPEDKAREMASVEGKYEKLLKRIEMPTDAAAYGQFTEFGYWAGKAWGHHKDLPKGHWVYVAPHWYIWGEKNASLGENK